MNDPTQLIPDGFLNGGAIPNEVTINLEDGLGAAQEAMANPQINAGVQAGVQAVTDGIQSVSEAAAPPAVEEEVVPEAQADPEAQAEPEAVEPADPSEDFYLLIGKHAEEDHGDFPVRTADAKEAHLKEEERSFDVGYGHKVKDTEWESKTIHGIPFVDAEGKFIDLTEDQKRTILTADMKAESDLARKNGWDAALKKYGTTWEKLDMRYRYALTSLAFNVGGSKAAEDWDLVLKAAKDKNKVDFAKHLRRMDNDEYTAGMDNRVLKELFYSMIIREASEVSEVLVLGNANQAGVPKGSPKVTIEEPKEFKTRGEAFNYHRKKGDKTFKWEGKLYNTEIKTP
tara:strand:+ start:2176 stop:3201 length:1026 start_codon:yes stop_codon:yes gene_type:complete